MNRNTDTHTRRKNMMFSLVFFIALKMAFNYILILMQCSMFSNDLSILFIVFGFLEDDFQTITVWRFKRQQGFLCNQILGSYSIKMFRDRMTVNKETFLFLCEKLGPNIKKFDTPMTANVDVETIVVVTLARLATDNTLFMIGDLYGIVKSIVSVVVRECCKAIKDELLSFVIEKIRIISTEFEAIKNIPYVTRAIDGFHLPIVDPSKDAPEYYYHKDFHSVILQGVVDAQCKFWDFYFGWPGSCHN